MKFMKNNQLLKTVFNISVGATFGICVLFLLLLGKCLGLNYKQISVYFNLYLQGVVLLCSALLPAIASIYELCHYISLLSILTACCMISYFSIYFAGIVWMFKHYKGDIYSSYALCVNDLQKVSKSWHVSYMTVNLIIFIGWWIALFVINVLLAYYILHSV